MKFKELFENVLNETNNTSYQEIKEWVNSLNLKGRSPKGFKKEFSLLQYAKKIIDNIDNYYSGKVDGMSLSQLQRIYDVDLKGKKEKINNLLSVDDNKPIIIKTKFATYYKEDGSSYDNYLKSIKDVDEFLNTLKGYHKKALKDLVIVFAKKSITGSKAKYKSAEDRILINLSSMGKSKEEYGSLRYVILHELGHRYLKFNKQHFNVDSIEWITTPYSKTDSFTSEEKFAELFALSHWKNKYKRYDEVIKKFEKNIK